MKRILFFASILLIFSTFMAEAQGTLEDYRRANSIRETYNSKVFYSDVRAEWIEDSHCFWYCQNTPDGINFIFADADKKKKWVAFTQRELAEQLAKATGEDIDHKKLSLRSVVFDRSCGNVSFRYNDGEWAFKKGKKGWTLSKTGHNSEEWRRGYWGERYDHKTKEPVISPDSALEVFLRNDNLYVRSRNDMAERQLSFDGSPGEYYSGLIRWSPDSKKVAVMKIRPAEQRYIYFVEAAPDDQLQPKLHKRTYFKPGDALPFHHPHIFDIESGKQIKPDGALFRDAYENHRMKWNEDSRAVTFEHNQRGHQIYRVIEIDAENGKLRTIIEESQPTFVNYNRYFRHDLDGGQEMIWMSERDNWGHLYMIDRATGTVKRQITQGEWYVREVINVDEQQRQIIFSANGITTHAGEDPYHVRFYRINFDGTELTCLSPEEGTHSARFSQDKKYFADIYSTVSTPPVAVLRETGSGKIILELEKADISALYETGWTAPETFSAKGRDGKTDMWGVIVRPSNFDPAKKYPVIEYIYAGPGSHHAPKSFAAFQWFMSDIAELGFIVVMLDGMGTSYRSKEFEDVICKNLKDSGFPDRKLWIKAAAEKYPYMDIDRVGIFGGSAGGQSAMAAVLFHPEFYKAAYAGCGCHDNRMDKIWWNEQWLGYPIGPHYAENSNVDNAWKLTRPLMLMVGEVDDNVDPASTMQVVKALQKAGKEFELVVVPSGNHTVGGRYGDRKRYDFFVRHLLGVTPPDWNNIEK